MIRVKIEGDPPNKQGDKTSPLLDAKLREAFVSQLHSKLIDSNVKVSIRIRCEKSRYRRKGNDNLYISDLDNLVSGICDHLKGRLIVDDDQISEIMAKRIEDDSLSEPVYEVEIEEQQCAVCATKEI